MGKCNQCRGEVDTCQSQSCGEELDDEFLCFDFSDVSKDIGKVHICNRSCWRDWLDDYFEGSVSDAEPE